MIKKLFPFIKEYKKPSILTMLCVTCEVALSVTIPYLMSLIIDKGIANSDLKLIITLGIAMIIVASLTLFLGINGSRFASIASTGFAKNLRLGVFSKIQNFSFKNTDKFTTPSLVTRLTYDINNLQRSYMMIIRMLVRAPLMFISSITMVLIISSRLASVFAFTIPFLVIGFFLIIRLAFPLFQKMFKKYDKMNASVQENLIGIRVVKSFVREDYEIEKFRKTSEDVKKTQLKAEKIVIFNGPIMRFCMNATIIAIVWFGGRMVVFGDLEVGMLFSFISYTTQILTSLMLISSAFVMLVISKASLNRIVEVLDELPDITNKDADEKHQIINGDIDFENVDFSYSLEAEKAVLKNLNFSIKGGETVGIIGATGSAKTSLVQLIPRLYDASRGAIKIDGVNVKNYTIKTLRKEIAMVLQKNVLFSGTIKDNLKWGNENATDEQIINACVIADAHDFIKSFKNKYDTVLTQGATNLSGGQKQRICIARALLKNPKILILDDSTSAVDTATDKKIKSEFKLHLKNTTQIIIAQRITSVMHADKIIVLSNGKIDAIGSHKELLRENDIYKDIYKLQLLGGK